MSTQHQTGAETEEFDTYWSHGWKKCKKQPLVPLGELLLLPSSASSHISTHLLFTDPCASLDGPVNLQALLPLVLLLLVQQAL